MLRNKKEVDQHVKDVLKKTKNEEERKLKGQTIARLYYQIGELEGARRYICEFLTISPKAADAQRLLGQIYEGLGNKEKAVQAYKNSYELSDGQKELVLKICNLYADIQCDPSVRLHWAEEGHSLFPHHESVVRLREALLLGPSDHSLHDMEVFYLDEIKARPLGVPSYVSLLKLYKRWSIEDPSMLTQAYEYGCQVESRKAFSESLEWYQTLLDVLENYALKSDVSGSIVYHTHHLSCLERLLYMSLSVSTSGASADLALRDAMVQLQKFDEALLNGLKIIGHDTLVGEALTGQLFFHMACYLLLKAKVDGLPYNVPYVATLLFHAVAVHSGDISFKNRPSLPMTDQFWSRNCSHRLSQAGHVLDHMAPSQSEKVKFLSKVSQHCSNEQCQENVYRAIFGTIDSKQKGKSYFLSNKDFTSTALAFPSLDLIKESDRVVSVVQCGSLREMVWLCLQHQQPSPSSLWEPPPTYPLVPFENLPCSSPCLGGGGAETLSHLDVLAFLVATVYTYAETSKETKGLSGACLPSILSPSLHTPDQAEWWSAVHAVSTSQSHGNMGRVRRVLQRGLETVRAVGNHGMGLNLIAYLAKTFTRWATDAKESGCVGSEVTALEERAELYWRQVVSECKKASLIGLNRAPANRLFVLHNTDLNEADRAKLDEEGKFFLAMRLMRVGKKVEAQQAFGDLKSPEASFERGMILKEQAGELRRSLAGEQDMAQCTSLFSQSRDAFYLAFDRLRMPGVSQYHPLVPRVAQQLEEVEGALRFISSRGGVEGVWHSLGGEEDAESLTSQTSHLDLTTNGHYGGDGVVRHSLMGGMLASTPSRSKNFSFVARQEARPSPERLDAQVRSLRDIQESTLHNLEEHNVALKVQNEALLSTCSTMAGEIKSHSAIYQSILEQSKTFSREAYAAVLEELKYLRLIHADIQDLKSLPAVMRDVKEQLKNLGADVAELRALKTSEKQAEIRSMDEHAAAAEHAQVPNVHPWPFYPPNDYDTTPQSPYLVASALTDHNIYGLASTNQQVVSLANVIASPVSPI